MGANSSQTHGQANTFLPKGAAPALLAAFARGTGWHVGLHPRDDSPDHSTCRPSACTVCVVVRQQPAGRAACHQFRHHLMQRGCTTCAPQRRRCHAGLTELAVPVFSQETHIATLIASRACTRMPTPAQITTLARRLGGPGSPGKFARQLSHAFARTPVIANRAQRAHLVLLELVAEKLGALVSRRLVPEQNCIHRARQLIAQRLTEPLTVKLVARHVHLSPAQFSRRWNAVTGLSLTEYLARLRVERAKVLLRDTDLKIVDLALEAGFQSHAAFYRWFGKLTGRSPTEYRRDVG